MFGGSGAFADRHGTDDLPVDLGLLRVMPRPVQYVHVRYFICNTPAAYAVVSVLHRPVEFASKSGRHSTPCQLYCLIER
jgi:hypothetical protein